MRELGGAQHAAGAAERHIAAVVVFNDPGLHVLTGEVGDRVDVRDQADAGLLLKARRGGQIAVDIGVLIDVYARYTELVEFALQLV